MARGATSGGAPGHRGGACVGWAGMGPLARLAPGRIRNTTATTASACSIAAVAAAALGHGPGTPVDGRASSGPWSCWPPHRGGSRSGHGGHGLQQHPFHHSGTGPTGLHQSCAKGVGLDTGRCSDVASSGRRWRGGRGSGVSRGAGGSVGWSRLWTGAACPGVGPCSHGVLALSRPGKRGGRCGP